MKGKVYDLELKCHTQSEKCNVLSEELEKFHLGSHTYPDCWRETTTSRRAICNLLNELQSCTGKGEQSLLKNCDIYHVCL